MKLDEYNRDRSKIEQRREEINESASYAAWMLDSFKNALMNDVFANTGNVDTGTGVDVINYALLVHSGNASLANDQRYGAQPADMSREQCSTLLQSALSTLQASLADNLNPKVIRAEDSGGRVLINRVVVTNFLKYNRQEQFQRDYLRTLFTR